MIKIDISEETHDKLKKIMEDVNCNTFNSVINELIGYCESEGLI